MFLGNSGPRTLFSIKVRRAVAIERYSAIGAEDERLILPGTMVVVKSKLDLGGGVKMVQLEDAGGPSLVPGFSFAHSVAELSKATSNLVISTTPDVSSTLMSALPAKLKAMQSYLSDESLQENACLALRNMALDAANQVPLVQANAHQRVMEAMRAHPHAQTLQEHACGALWGMAVNAANQVPLVQANAHQRVMEAMRAHPHAETLQEIACGALSNMGVES